MSNPSLQTLAALPFVNGDPVLRSLLADAEKIDDAVLFVSNLDARSTIHVSPPFERLTGYAVFEVMDRGPEFLLKIADEHSKTDIVARQASYTAFVKQENFDPKSIFIQELPVVVNTRNGEKLPLHVMGTMLTFTTTQDPEIYMEIWSHRNQQTITMCMELLFKIKRRHNETYSHLPFHGETNPLIPVFSRRNDNRLSKREQEVIKLLSQGYSTKEIAENLQISFNTIETHRKHLLQKFEAKNVAELIKKASKIFWLE